MTRRRFKELYPGKRVEMRFSLAIGETPLFEGVAEGRVSG
jgi:hypothetical protein